jgi:hypothetical protein
MIVPLLKVNERIQVAKNDSDTALFMNLMYAGEQLLKLVTAAIVSGIENSADNLHNDKYTQNYKLVHADSIGVWVQILENVVSGCTIQLN